MNTRTLAFAALTLAGTLGAASAHAYMGDGCGRNAQLHISRHTGQAVCRPFAPPPVAVVQAMPPIVTVVPGFGGFNGFRGAWVAPAPAMFPHGGYRGVPLGVPGGYVNRAGHGGYAGQPGGPGNHGAMMRGR